MTNGGESSPTFFCKCTFQRTLSPTFGICSFHGTCRPIFRKCTFQRTCGLGRVPFQLYPAKTVATHRPTCGEPVEPCHSSQRTFRVNWVAARTVPIRYGARNHHSSQIVGPARAPDHLHLQRAVSPYQQQHYPRSVPSPLRVLRVFFEAGARPGHYSIDRHAFGLPRQAGV